MNIVDSKILSICSKCVPTHFNHDYDCKYNERHLRCYFKTMKLLKGISFWMYLAFIFISVLDRDQNCQYITNCQLEVF